MKKACIVTHPAYQENRLFDLSNGHLNRDNCLHAFHQLKQTFLENDIDLATSDIHDPEKADWVIYNEAPASLPRNHDPSKSILLLFETELIRPENWNLNLHKEFQWIFTWNDDFVNNDHYYKFNFSHLFPDKIENVPFHKRKFCTLIAGNKMVSHPFELYSQRLQSIAWFEKNHSEQFDYYGMGWDQINWGHPVLNKVARKLKISKILKAKTSKCYRGLVDTKKEVLKEYKFSICYENAQKIPGYITEKIFDSFFAGCVPVYWGASNISSHIPKDTFVDRRDFSSHEELYEYLAGMTEAQFQQKAEAIQSFLSTSASRQFTSQHFAETIVGHVKNQK